jgi:hypothetical protein
MCYSLQFVISASFLDAPILRARVNRLHVQLSSVYARLAGGETINDNRRPANREEDHERPHSD